MHADQEFDTLDFSGFTLGNEGVDLGAQVGRLDLLLVGILLGARACLRLEGRG